MEAAELAELEAQLARAEERIVQEIDRLKEVCDQSDLTQLLNRCCMWYVRKDAVRQRKGERKRQRRRGRDGGGVLGRAHAFPDFPVQFLDRVDDVLGVLME